jgi:hypothetical protein
MQEPSVRKQETILARNKQRSENVDGAACLKLQKITVRTYGNLLCRVLATEQEVKLNATASHCCCLANSGALLMATTCRLLCWVTDRPEVRTGSVKAIAARQWVCLGRTRTPRDGIDYGISGCDMQQENILGKACKPPCANNRTREPRYQIDCVCSKADSVYNTPSCTVCPHACFTS